MHKIPLFLSLSPWVNVQSPSKRFVPGYVNSPLGPEEARTRNHATCDEPFCLYVREREWKRAALCPYCLPPPSVAAIGLKIHTHRGRAAAAALSQVKASSSPPSPVAIIIRTVVVILTFECRLPHFTQLISFTHFHSTPPSKNMVRRVARSLACSGLSQSSAKRLILGCVTGPWARGRVTQPRKRLLAELCTLTHRPRSGGMREGGREGGREHLAG